MDKETILQKAQNEKDEFKLQIDLKSRNISACIITIIVVLIYSTLQIISAIKESFPVDSDLVACGSLFIISLG